MFDPNCFVILGLGTYWLKYTSGLLKINLPYRFFFQMIFFIPVDTRRRFNAYMTSIDVETTSCVDWDYQSSHPFTAHWINKCQYFFKSIFFFNRIKFYNCPNRNVVCILKVATLKFYKFKHNYKDKCNTAWKMCKYGAVSGPYFSAFSPNTGKYGPEITPYLDTFHAVRLDSKTA